MPDSFREFMNFDDTKIRSDKFTRVNQLIRTKVPAKCLKQSSLFNFITKVANLILVICVCFTISFSADFRKHNRKTAKGVVVKIVRISDEVYMLSTSGAEIGVGNVGLSIGTDGILMVDTQIASLAPEIKSAVKKISSGKVRFVINTHWHADHTGGNEIFGREATIIAQKNVRPNLSDDDLIAMPKGGLPVINYDESLSLNFNDDEIRIMHFPKAHTSGDSVVLFARANVIHLGDLYKGHRFPGVDTSHGGSVLGLAAAIGRIITMLPENVKIIPGHGELSNLDDLRIYHRMLLETTAFVDKEISRGKTLEEIKKEGLPAEFNSWNNGLTNSDLWIEQIYQSLANEKNDK